MTEIKFCGMTRPEDAREAAALGARYVGVIFADSPRQVSNDRATQVLSSVPDGIARVGVFGATPVAEVARRAELLSLDVVQLHADPSGEAIVEMRRLWSGLVWAVVRVAGAAFPDEAKGLFELADAVVLDAHVEGKLGGTGVPLDWSRLNDRLGDHRGQHAKLVVAGGLTADNVVRAVEALNPDVVDVSSGVESSVGVKDHSRMRAFRDAVLTGAAR